MSPIEIADAVIVDIDLAFDLAADNAKKESEDWVVQKRSLIIVDFANGLGSMSKDDYDCED